MKKVSHIPLYKLVPNIITILALCLGITSVRYAIDGEFSTAAALIVLAAFMDGIDGRMARLLNCSSNFGAQLDSLADMVNFGVAPSLLMYMWSLHTIPYKGIGWLAVLVYVACSALRLARFNVQQEDVSIGAMSKHFFTGMPMPAAAVMSIMPLVLTFRLIDWVMPSWLVLIYISLLGFMMVSTIPTFSAKKLSIDRAYVPWILLCVSLVMIWLLLEPWITLPFIGVAYCLSIPYSIMRWRKISAQITDK